MDGCLQAAGTVVIIRQVLKTRLDHVPNSFNNHYLHIAFLAHPVRSILVQEVCYFIVKSKSKFRLYYSVLYSLA